MSIKNYRVMEYTVTGDGKMHPKVHLANLTSSQAGKIAERLNEDLMSHGDIADDSPIVSYTAEMMR